MEFKDYLKESLDRINIDIKEDNVEKFNLYMKELLEWNEKINLTAITEEKDIILKHFVDSLTALKYIKKGSKVIDIGTGAGFPGIPLKIQREDIKIILMDSLNKRINFLKEMIIKLSLENIEAIHSRAEELARNIDYREGYDIAISRAVANLSTLVEYMLPFVKIGGKCICMKGSNIDEEVENSKKAIKELGGKLIKVDNFILPNSDYERNIIIIEKVSSTKEKYPRKAGIPSKEPIR